MLFVHFVVFWMNGFTIKFHSRCVFKSEEIFIGIRNVYLSQINSTLFFILFFKIIFIYYQIELNFKLFRQFPKFNLPESWIYKYAIHLIETFPPIKHKKINLVHGFVVEPVIKSSVTNFNHHISRAWD